MIDRARSMVNFAHLDHLSEVVEHGGEAVRIVHIYAAAPTYERMPDPEEGTSCVDDVARAAVLYLRHFELTGEAASREAAAQLLRFVLSMQAESGLFFNFVINTRLDINRTHFRSRADALEWWTCRAVWALATACRVLNGANPDLAGRCAEAVSRVLPHLEAILEHYPQVEGYRTRKVPTWLVHGDGADATSELMLGLVAMNDAHPSLELQSMITRFAEGIALMRYGSMNQFPYGLHASNKDGWHKWGNAQTQALAEAGIVVSAKLEADHFYPRLLVEGLIHSISFDDLHAIQYFERTAYGVRAISVGLLRLFEATGDVRYAKMAGLAATWFTGNNEAGVPMYDSATGRCYDGVDGPDRVNYNSGAESTIEALYTLVEVERHEEALAWTHVRAGGPAMGHSDGVDCVYREFTAAGGTAPRRLAVVLDLTHERFDLLEGDALEAFLRTME